MYLIISYIRSTNSLVLTALHISENDSLVNKKKLYISIKNVVLKSCVL